MTKVLHWIQLKSRKEYGSSFVHMIIFLLFAMLREEEN